MNIPKQLNPPFKLLFKEQDGNSNASEKHLFSRKVYLSMHFITVTMRLIAFLMIAFDCALITFGQIRQLPLYCMFYGILTQHISKCYVESYFRVKEVVIMFVSVEIYTWPLQPMFIPNKRLVYNANLSKLNKIYTLSRPG